MEGTYEYELERAELLGIEPISRDLWEEQEKARKEVEKEQEQTEVAKELENEDEKLKGASGKMDELNNILSATQQRLNKFKVCKYLCAKVLYKQTESSFLDRLRKFHDFAENQNRKSSASGRSRISIQRSSSDIINQRRIRQSRSNEGNRPNV